MPKCRKGKVVENRVGRRYRKAGYNVKLRKRTPSGEVDVYATRKGERIVGEVKYRSKKNAVPPKEVKKVAKKARSQNSNNLAENGVRHILARVKHPQTNGKIERFFGEVERRARKLGLG